VSLLPILLYGDPRLRTVAEEVEVTAAVRTLAADMIETMYAAPGRGLAAPQVGESLRLFVMDCQWKDGVDRDPVVVVNPRILAQSTRVAPYTEGCLSIPGVPVEIERPAEVTLRWSDLDGTLHERVFAGFAAVCVQHEYDHLDGKLITDRMSEADAALHADRLAALKARRVPV
jgi:peptide deformylase